MLQSKLMYYIKVGPSKRFKRGVFAEKDFEKGEIIEICPCVEIPESEEDIIQQTIISYYAFEWKTLETSALVLGYGMIYNHSIKPHAEYFFDFKKKLVTFKALRNIKKGTEILINFNQYAGDKKLEMIHPFSGDYIIV